MTKGDVNPLDSDNRLHHLHLDPVIRQPYDNLRQGGYVSIGLSVCLIAELCKNYPADCHRICWRGEAWVKKEPVIF